jgi:hypothetical protein
MLQAGRPEAGAACDGVGPAVHGPPGFLVFVVGLGVGRRVRRGCRDCLAAPVLESRDEGIVPVALAGHLGSEVAAEHAEGAAGHVAGGPCGQVVQVGETTGGFVGCEAEDDVPGALLGEETGVPSKSGRWGLLRSIHQTVPGTVCSRMLAESSLWW